ncbi:multidrug ABC transporter ATP-binding protein [Brumimicrobium salinarum]|uniref:Multidrug ABC transporter ATP-binding protein n=1 Tax=Brumimicrobium salinarum TaxID=2058658 RepID=A0A2I0R2M7_9FLAO|nr:ABC transporter transmembrane domain-containing protein [Brumimicrobium salinarum]PKR80838.1 multidrug ABC transporter ATP-binding protein [Brumimicrobium salinarum]
MLKPKKKKNKTKTKLSKASVQKAKKIFSYLKPYRFYFFVGWIFLVLSSTAGLFFPYLLGQLLGSDLPEDTASPSNEQLLQNLDLNNINTVALVLLVLLVLQSVFSFFRVVIFTKVTENTLRDIRKDAYDKLIYMPMDFFNKNKVGELTSRIAADITLIQDTLRTTIAEFFRQIIIIIGSIIFITIVSWRLALIMLATVPVMAIIAVVFGRFIRKLSKKAQDSSASSNTIIEEGLMGITNVKTFTNEIFMISKYRKSIEEIRRLNIKSGNWRGLFISFIIMCLFGAIIFIIWQGLHMTVGPDATLDKGDFFSFIMFTVFMGASIGSLPDLYANMQKAVGATEHLMDIISNDTEKQLHKGTDTSPIKGNVVFDAVSFHYPQRKDVQVLNQLSFSANKGDKIALVGSSGAGKSTIASLIQRFYSPTEGKYTIDGKNVETYELNHLRENMALVPQEVILFSGTIRENILFGKQNATDEEVKAAAKKANALTFIDSFPEGFETEVGDRGIQLSGGQKQRIAIARAILKDPNILILDEATSALDAESERLVQEALDNLMENRTSFIIAHRLSTIRKADTILVLEHGKIVEKGTHEELIRKENGVYANLNELQIN